MLRPSADAFPAVFVTTAVPEVIGGRIFAHFCARRGPDRAPTAVEEPIPRSKNGIINVSLRSKNRIQMTTDNLIEQVSGIVREASRLMVPPSLTKPSLIIAGNNQENCDRILATVRKHLLALPY